MERRILMRLTKEILNEVKSIQRRTRTHSIYRMVRTHNEREQIAHWRGGGRGRGEKG